MKTIPAMHCEHANEVPQTCPCPPNCYCKKHTCKRKAGGGRIVPKVMLQRPLHTPMRTSHDELAREAKEWDTGVRTPQGFVDAPDAVPGIRAGIYEHYKGGFYQILGLGAHAVTDERMVVYIALALRPGPRMRLRPIEIFGDLVKWPSGEMKPRFLYRGDEIPNLPPESHE